MSHERGAEDSAAGDAQPVRFISAQVGLLRVTRVIPVAQAVPSESELRGKGMPWLGALLCLALLAGCGQGNVAGAACSRKALTDLGEELGRVIADRVRWGGEFPGHDAKEAADEARLRTKIAEVRAKGCSPVIPALAQALGVVLLLVFLAVSVAAQFRRLWADEDSAERQASPDLPAVGKVALVAGLVLVGLCGGCRVALRFRPIEAVQNGEAK